MRSVLFLFTLTIWATHGLAGLPDNPVEYAAWESRSLVAIAKFSTLPPEQAIPELELRMIQLSREHSPNWEKGDRPVFHAAQAALLAIPGHAEYYRDKILQAQERAKTIGPPALSGYASENMYGFQALKLLPSPEGVRVLGELLSNNWVPPGNDTAALSEKFAPLSVSARVALQEFPLLDKPFKDPITSQNAADANAAWQLWYEQIKSGKRTFRFEGDPTEYDLNGPTPGQKLAHITRDRKRDVERAAGRERTSESSVVAEPAATSKPSKSIPVALIIAGMILLVSLGWYFLRGRSREVS